MDESQVQDNIDVSFIPRINEFPMNPWKSSKEVIREQMNNLSGKETMGKCYLGQKW